MKKTLSILFFLTLISIISVNAQNKTTKSKETKDTKETYNIVKEGKGMNDITVGKSTMNDVIKKFGKDYKWVVNKKYSYQMTYPKSNLSFYICQSDKKKEIFLIEIKRPYKAKTSRGIILGKSDVKDIQKYYGKSKSGLEYRGVSFYYNNVDGKEVVTEIDITENSGIRQCKTNK